MEQFKLNLQVELFSLVHQDTYTQQQLLSEANRLFSQFQGDLRKLSNVTTLNGTTILDKVT